MSVTVAASVVFHDSVDELPLRMLEGDAASEAVGIGTVGGAALTVTVAVFVVDPAALVATSVYDVVAAGESVCVPSSETAFPFKVTEVASVVFQTSVEDWPLWIDDGVAVNVAVGIGAGAGVVPDTVTVALDVARWSSWTATSA